MQITLMPNGRVLTIEPGETLLSALRREGEPISHSCEDGRCGLCRCGLVYPDQITSENSLDHRVEHRSVVLACQTVPTSDCLLELPDAEDVLVVPPQVQRAKVVAIEPLTEHVRRLRVRPYKPLLFVPGQSLDLRLSSNITRRYSPASLPNEPELTFHIRVHPDGLASHYLTDVLRPGETIRLQGPYGTAYLRQRHTTPILFVSSGTGLGPMLAQLRSLALAGARPAVHVYAGFAMSEEAYGREEFEQATQNLASLRQGAYVIGGGTLRRGDRQGLITDVINADFPDLVGWTAYVFGSPYAVDSIARLLQRKGISPGRLHAEPFLFSSS